MALDTLLGWSSHISTIMLITGSLHLALIGVRAAKLPADNPIKRWGENGISAALFPMGILQFVSFALYLWTILVGARGPASLPPEYAQYSLIYTILTGGSMVTGSLSAIGQIGRKVPWAVLTGGAVGAVGAGSVWTVANGTNLATLPVLGGSALIGLILFVSMFFITLPGQEVVKTTGDFFAFSPITLANGTLMSLLGALSAMGLVVL